jgi:hypothetical protein
MQATRILSIARRFRTMADAAAVVVAAAPVVGVIRLGAPRRRRLGVRRVRGTFRPRMFRRAAGGAVLFARLVAAAPRLAVAASSRRSPIAWLTGVSSAVAAVTIPSFVAGALRRAAVVATNVVVAIVVDSSATRGAIASSERAIAAVVAAPKLVAGAASAARVRRVADLATDALRRLAEYAPSDALVLLAFERAVIFLIS